MKLSNELLQGIKLLKIYGWEKLFYGLIKQAREKELAQIFKMYIVISVNCKFFFTWIVTYMKGIFIQIEYDFIVSRCYNT